MAKIYLDYAATTPVDERVINRMKPYFDELFGNTSSIHTYGQQAESALENARETMAGVFNCKPDEVLFTSCGSESDNLALRGTALAARQQHGANHILISPVEHHAVSKTAQQLAAVFGFELEYLRVDQYGCVDPSEVRRHLRKDTALVSIIYANNEIGTINQIEEIGKICREQQVPLHTDAVQAGAYLSLDVQQLNIDLLSVGAHKLYGPKGVGALYVRQGTPIMAVQTGGSQEFGLRAGTHNTPYIIGQAEAFRLAQLERLSRSNHVLPLRNHLVDGVLAAIPDARLTGHPRFRLPNHASFAFEHVDGNALLMLLDIAGFACSSGSACKTGNPEPSEVLSAIGLTSEWASGSLRLTLGMHSVEEHIRRFLEELPDIISRVRALHR